MCLQQFSTMPKKPPAASTVVNDLPPAPAWSEQREKAMRLWIRQLVSLSFLFMRAARFTRGIIVGLNFMSFFGSLYTFPTNGCGLVSGLVCVQLQWSGIIIGLISAICSGMSMVYDLGKRAELYENTQITLMQISRCISLELQKDIRERTKSGSEFAEFIVQSYDKAVEDVRLPWYIQGEQQLANISLLQTYQGATLRQSSLQCRSTESDSTSSDKSQPTTTTRELEPPTLELNDRDRAAMEKIQLELERLGSFSMNLENEQISQ